MIQNPVLPGFHPDPSIVRVGADYYMATSTFEWWPAVRIHHSRDLVNWRHQSYAVTRTSQLDLRGHGDSTGVWAPCLSHAHGQFWLIYSDVRSMYGAYKDAHNYLITAPSIDGPWSEPIYMNSSGFDPSLFHDEDGRSWFLNQQWLHHADRHPFNGILLQEYDHAQRRLIGPVKNIFRGTALGVVEGPHLYRREGWYYLLTAEGGTTYQHAATLARSRQIDGPYELLPGNPLMTADGSPTDAPQRAGHASWVQTEQGEWYMAHLSGRPVEWNGGSKPVAAGNYEALHCILGRETSLQKLHWRPDGWPELSAGGRFPANTVPAPTGLALQPWPTEPAMDDFDAAKLSPHWNTLRLPTNDSWLSLTERPGHLRLRGRESLMSTFEQSLVARRQQHLRCRVETVLDFAPTSFQQMAGLLAYYSTQNHAYLHVSANADSPERRELRLLLNRDGLPTDACAPLPLPACGPVYLALELDHDRLRCWYALAPAAWQAVGEALDCSYLSDEFACRQRDGFFYGLGFTGNFVGLACQDLAGTRLHADFDHFSYTPQP